MNSNPWVIGDVQGVVDSELGSVSVQLATPLNVADYTTWTSLNTYTFGGVLETAYAPLVLTSLAYQPTLVTYTQPTYVTNSDADAGFSYSGSADYTVWRPSLEGGVTLTMSLVQPNDSSIQSAYLSDYSNWLTFTGGALQLSSPTAGNAPEPASICLAATALLGLLIVRRTPLTL